MQVNTLSSVSGNVVSATGMEAASGRAGQAAAVGQPGSGQVATPAQTAVHTPDPAEVKKAVESLNKAVLNLNNSLQFSVDEDTKIDVVKVIDMNSKEVLRQIPSVEVLSIAKAIDRLQGMLIKDKA